MWNSLPDSVVMADRPTVKLTNLKMGLISTGLNMHFCMTIVLTIMEPEACLLYRKSVKFRRGLIANACVHSLQSSTVQNILPRPLENQLHCLSLVRLRNLMKPNLDQLAVYSMHSTVLTFY